MNGQIPNGNIGIIQKETDIIGQKRWLETLSSHRHFEIILNQFLEGLTEEESLYDWFQQDSAPVHRALNSEDVGSAVFDDRVIIDNVWTPQ